jgi:hypothetical protein
VSGSLNLIGIGKFVVCIEARGVCPTAVKCSAVMSECGERSAALVLLVARIALAHSSKQHCLKHLEKNSASAVSLTQLAQVCLLFICVARALKMSLITLKH